MACRALTRMQLTYYASHIHIGCYEFRQHFRRQASSRRWSSFVFGHQHVKLSLFTIMTHERRNKSVVVQLNLVIRYKNEMVKKKLICYANAPQSAKYSVCLNQSKTQYCVSHSKHSDSNASRIMYCIAYIFVLFSFLYISLARYQFGAIFKDRI